MKIVLEIMMNEINQLNLRLWTPPLALYPTNPTYKCSCRIKPSVYAQPRKKNNFMGKNFDMKKYDFDKPNKNRR